MANKLFVLLALITFNSQLIAQNRATGEIVDFEELSKAKTQVRLSERSFENMPTQASVEQWCPTPGNQGEFGTCAAFGTAYGLATILYSKTHNITDKAQINQYRFSPSWVYELGKEEDDKDCQSGSNTYKNLYILGKMGAVLMSTLPYHCNPQLTDAMVQEAANYKVGNAKIIYASSEFSQKLNNPNLDVGPEGIIGLTKMSLASGYPLCFSAICPPSFQKSGKIWNWDPNEPATNWKHQTHSMVAVGYDDNVGGGAFKILNSWGTEYADGGFVWVKYNDYAKFVNYAILTVPDPNTAAPGGAPQPAPKPAPQPTPNPQPQPAPKPQPAPAAENTFQLSGSVDFTLNTGEEMPIKKTSTRNLTVEDDEPAAKEDLVAYTMEKTYSSGTKFRFYMKVDREAYVYAFATDLNGHVNRILPFDDQVSTQVIPNSVIAFPSDSKVVKMDETKGRDYLLILYSAGELNSREIADKMNSMKGAFSDKIKAVLGTKLIDKQNITYDTAKVGFSTKKLSTRNLTVEEDDKPTANGGSVVPLMVEIKHN